MFCWKMGEQGSLCVFPVVSDNIRSPEDLEISHHDQLYHHSCLYLTPSLWTCLLRQQHTSVFQYQARCWESAGTGKGKESPRSRDRLCSAFALCDRGPWSTIKVPGYDGDMNINDPVIRTSGKELYLHLIQDYPRSPTQPLSNGFIFMGFSFLIVK